MTAQDDHLCDHLHDALRTAWSAVDARFVEYAHALLEALCATIELRAVVLNEARRSPPQGSASSGAHARG